MDSDNRTDGSFLCEKHGKWLHDPCAAGTDYHGCCTGRCEHPKKRKQGGRRGAGGVPPGRKTSVQRSWPESPGQTRREPVRAFVEGGIPKEASEPRAETRYVEERHFNVDAGAGEIESSGIVVIPEFGIPEGLEIETGVARLETYPRGTGATHRLELFDTETGETVDLSRAEGPLAAELRILGLNGRPLLEQSQEDAVLGPEDPTWSVRPFSPIDALFERPPTPVPPPGPGPSGGAS